MERPVVALLLVVVGGCSFLDDFSQFRAVGIDGGVDGGPGPDAEAPDPDSGDRDASNPGDASGDDSGVCVAPLAPCEEGRCVDTLSSVLHCGACDSPCGELEVCSDGQCSAPTVRWGLAVDGVQLGQMLLLDPSTLIVAGQYTGAPELGGERLPTAAGTAGLLVGLNADSGQVLWTRTLGGAVDVRALRLARGPAGAGTFAVAGTHSESFTVDGVEFSYEAAFDTWVATFNATGVLQRAASITSGTPVGLRAFAASAGAAFVNVSSDDGPVTVNGAAVYTSAGCQGGLLIFDDQLALAQATPLQWCQGGFASTVFEGGLHVVGEATGGAVFDGTVLADEGRGLDVRFDLDGTFVRLGPPGQCSGRERYFRTEATSNQTRVIGGTCEGVLTFGGGKEARGLFVAELDVNDALVGLWSVSSGFFTAGIDDAGDGTYYHAGSFQGPTDLGFGPVAPAGAEDGYLISLEARGLEPRWAFVFGGPGTESARDVVALPNAAVVGGSFDASFSVGSVSFDAPESGTGTFLLRVEAP